MSASLRRVSIDVTPMLPGGANGGAKLLTLSLIREMANLAPETEFILLSSEPNHAELAALEANNVRRQPVEVDTIPTQQEAPGLATARATGRTLVNALLPPRARSRVKDAAWSALKRHRRQQLANTMSRATDLHFCPFTAPFFFDPNVPLVSLVHDVQFLDCPEFFEPQQRHERRDHFLDACARAERVICVSEFVRNSVLRNSTRAPETVTTIPTGVLRGGSREPPPDKLLASMGIATDRYLFYPANAWPHKNHRRLMEAFAAFLDSQPGSDLALVCTGAPDPRFDQVIQLAHATLPNGRFGFAGFVSETAYAALLGNCRALIFPSLYEGFGMPLLEAMACERPVLCSDATSLPEVAGDAAIFFDASQPAAINAAIQRLESDPQLEERLIQRGTKRVQEFGSVRDLAGRYLAVFDEVVAARQRAQRSRAGH